MDTEAFAEHLFGSLLGAMDALTVAIGDRLGLYDALHHAGSATAPELAARAAIHPRYAREWLEQQTVAGLLAVDDPGADADERRYTLPAEHVPVLVDRDSLAYFRPFLNALVPLAQQVPAVVEAFRTGGGVPWQQYGPSMRQAQADANRALFLTVLGQEWLPSVPDVHARLVAGGRVADVGCGDGWSAIGMALAYPDITVDGFDIDADSVRAATRHAEEYGLSQRVRFHCVDGADTRPAGSYDLVTAFECVHDMGDPVAVLGGMRDLAGDDGVVLVVDERTPESFTGAGDPVEQLFYGFSVLVCLPDGMSHDGSVGTGTVMRPATLRSYARDAGFHDVEVLGIEHDFFRAYRLC
jgi:2-polyprenyl-3-methyl-5-hydroxy-6-metoxy-1,4-benzoquinol methylase